MNKGSQDQLRDFERFGYLISICVQEGPVDCCDMHVVMGLFKG